MNKNLNISLHFIGYFCLVAVSIILSCKSASTIPASEQNPKLYQVAETQLSIATEHTEELELIISYPAQSKDNFPLIVFSHGNGLDGNSYDNLTHEWVRQGYVVVAPNHLDSGSPEVAAAAQKEYGSDWVSASRVLDLSESISQIDEIITQLPGFSGRVDTKKVIAAGHSFGALTAQMLAGATLELQGNSERPIPSVLKDDNIVAVIAISPPGLIPHFLSEKTWSTFETPQLVVTGTKDITPPFWPNYEDHLVSYQSAVAGHNYLLVLDGADHYLGNLIGDLDREEEPQALALENMIEQSVNFINYFVKPSPAHKLHAPESVRALKGIVRYERR